MDTAITAVLLSCRRRRLGSLKLRLRLQVNLGSVCYSKSAAELKLRAAIESKTTVNVKGTDFAGCVLVELRYLEAKICGKQLLRSS